ncbi:hypothetical protein K456DRAFT_978353 [Colletotrichum gloeosporioides 23]|nr:hypothetical protein K456DRAFT_978353 [Colletotrichum gloeosporioides 23]
MIGTDNGRAHRLNAPQFGRHCCCSAPPIGQTGAVVGQEPAGAHWTSRAWVGFYCKVLLRSPVATYLTTPRIPTIDQPYPPCLGPPVSIQFDFGEPARGPWSLLDRSSEKEEDRKREKAREGTPRLRQRLTHTYLPYPCEYPTRTLDLPRPELPLYISLTPPYVRLPSSGHPAGFSATSSVLATGRVAERNSPFPPCLNLDGYPDLPHISLSRTPR